MTGIAFDAARPIPDPGGYATIDDVKCEVAREALSARIDDEREPVPAARVDEHLDECADCCAWFVRAQNHARRLRVSSPQAVPELSDSLLSVLDHHTPAGRRTAAGWVRRNWAQALLAAAGAAQVLTAALQVGGLSYGMLPAHHMTTTGESLHLMNETTAWQFAVGAGMVIGAIWARAIPGLAIILTVFALILTGYVAVDAAHDSVTAARILSHLPTIVGAIAAGLAWRRLHTHPPSRYRAVLDSTGTHLGNTHPGPSELRLPGNATLGRRRSHMRPTDAA